MKLDGFFKAFADETRLRIVNLLQDQELNVNELTAILKMGQSRISRHLKILLDAQILNFRKDGLWSFYFINKDEEIQQFIKNIRSFFKGFPAGSHDFKERDLILKNRGIETARLFNSLAGDWEKIKAGIFGAFDLNRIIKDAVSPCTVLADFGCGTGDLLMHLVAKAVRVIGVDNSPVMLAKAGQYLEQYQDKIQLRLGTLEHLPLGDKEADTAIINMVLHHIVSLLPVLVEIHRVLNTNGKLIIVDFKKHEVEVLRTKYGDRRLGFDDVELDENIRQAGFIVKEKRSYSLEQGLEILFYETYKQEENYGRN